MPRKLRPIPKFHSEDEEREFWGTHDTTEYFDWSKATFVTFPNLKLSTETISLRLPAGLLADLKVLANRMDVPYQSLMKVYLAERVEQEMRRDRTPAELASVVREPEAPYGLAPAGTHRGRGIPRSGDRANPGAELRVESRGESKDNSAKTRAASKTARPLRRKRTR